MSGVTQIIRKFAHHLEWLKPESIKNTIKYTHLIKKFTIMKKFNFVFGAFALVAGMALTSCAGDNDGLSVINQDDIKVQAAGNKLIVSSDVEATFSFAGETQTGLEATFSTTEKAGVLKVSAEGYIAQESEVNFSEQNSVQKLSFQLTKKSENEVAQEAAKGTTVYGAPNSWGVVSGIQVPADVEISGTSNKFAVSTYEPTGVINTNDLAEGQVLSGAVLTLDCQPSGAKFSKPVTLTASIPEGINTNFEFVAQNGNEVVPASVEGNLLKADVNHFSPWNFVIRARILRLIAGYDVITNVAPIRPGNNAVSVPARHGWAPRSHGHRPSAFVGALRMIANFLNSLFGSAYAEDGEDTVTFDIPAIGVPAIITYQVKYQYKEITFVSGDDEFTITVYTGVSIPEIINIEWYGPKPHHGGATAE